MRWNWSFHKQCFENNAIKNKKLIFMKKNSHFLSSSVTPKVINVTSWSDVMQHFTSNDMKKWEQSVIKFHFVLLHFPFYISPYLNWNISNRKLCENIFLMKSLSSLHFIYFSSSSKSSSSLVFLLCSKHSISFHPFFITSAIIFFCVAHSGSLAVMLFLAFWCDLLVMLKDRKERKNLF